MYRTGVAVAIGNAVVWAAVLLGTALALRGTGSFGQISTVLGGGAAASVLLVGGGIQRLSDD